LALAAQSAQAPPLVQPPLAQAEPGSAAARRGYPRERWPLPKQEPEEQRKIDGSYIS